MQCALRTSPIQLLKQELSKDWRTPTESAFATETPANFDSSDFRTVSSRLRADFSGLFSRGMETNCFERSDVRLSSLGADSGHHRDGVLSAYAVAVKDAEGFVLAGGRSSRMGQDKGSLRIAGRSLLQIARDKLRILPLAAKPRIVGAVSEDEMVADLHPGCGPLSGIEAALIASTQPFNLFLPVDMPLLPAKFLRWMLGRAELTGAKVTLPRFGGRPQPLCAVYQKSIAKAITAAVLAGNYKVVPVVCSAASEPQALDIFDVELVAAADNGMQAFSALPIYRWFHNCNRPEDLEGVENALVLTQ